jgi:hypothetical protein
MQYKVLASAKANMDITEETRTHNLQWLLSLIHTSCDKASIALWNALTGDILKEKEFYDFCIQAEEWNWVMWPCFVEADFTVRVNS